MSINDDDTGDQDQKKRIEELKRKASELTGGQMNTMESEDISPDISEAFWEQVVEYESAPWISNFQQLQEAGIELPPADEMDDEKLKAKLWEVIEKLGKMRVFLYSTNHLSDRELYAHLWGDALREEMPAMNYDENSAWNIDLVSSGSEEDTHLWMKYYADEETRQQWKSDWPDYDMPAHENPPYNRDAFLPQAHYGVPDDGEPEMPM